jgi:hypothetical protein
MKKAVLFTDKSSKTHSDSISPFQKLAAVFLRQPLGRSKKSLGAKPALFVFW